MKSPRMVLVFVLTAAATFSAHAAGSVEETLKQKNIVLSQPTTPVGHYVEAVRVGNLLFISGHGPGVRAANGKRGKVGKDLTIDEGYQAARSAGLNMLATVKANLGSLDKVKKVVKVFGMVNVAPGFVNTPKVIDGFSDLMVEVFGDPIGKHARTAVGMAELPGNVPVEIEAVMEVE